MLFKCPNCIKEYNSLQSVTRHWTRSHKKTTKELYLLLNNLDKPPTCKCGCGVETKFLDAGRGFSNFVLGHASRIPEKNNFVTKKAQEKSQKTRKKMWKEGELEIWNKGLTKENSESVAKYGASCSKTIRSNEEEIKARSKRMRKNRLGGTVPTLYGKNHSQWSGGTSSLLSTCHANKILYHKWKYPIMVKYKFTCQLCGASRNDKPRATIEVHHNKESMADIVRKIAKEKNWEGYYGLQTKANNEKIFKLKEEISNAVAQYHIDKPVSGIILCKKCHKKQHGKHNF